MKFRKPHFLHPFVIGAFLFFNSCTETPVENDGLDLDPPIGKTYGSTFSEGAVSVWPTSDGGYVATGYANYTEPSSQVLLIRSDASLNQLWIKTYGGNQADIGQSVQQTTDGGFIIAATTSSYGAGGSDFWLVKTDIDGNQQWAKPFGGSNDETASAVRQTRDGGYLIIGTTRSFGNSSNDAWLVKTDASGTLLWSKTFGGTDADAGAGCLEIHDGRYIFTGYTASNGTGMFDGWLVKTDREGNELWSKTFGGSGNDLLYAVDETTEGGYVLFGSTTSFGSGSNDVWILQTDSTGKELSSRTYGGTGQDVAYSGQFTGDGGVIAAGSTSVGSGLTDIFILRIDAVGVQQWLRFYGGAYNDFAESVCQTHDGGFIVAGRTFSYGAGSYDAWLIKTNSLGN